MGISKKRMTFIYVLMGVIIALAFFTIPIINAVSLNPLVILMFMVNAVLWVTMLCRSLVIHPYSLQIIHWFFFLFFFFFAALIQYMNRAFPWVGMLSDETVLFGNIIALVWSVFFILGGKIKVNNKCPINAIKKFSQKQIPLDCGIAMVVIMIICVLIATYSIATTGFVNLLARSTANTSWSDNSSIDMVFSHATRAFCTFSALFSVHIVRKTGRFRFRAVIILICLLITAFPTGVARYAMASIYGALFITLFPSLKKNRFFIIVFMVGFVVVLPFLNSFRNLAFEDVNIILSLKKAVQKIPIAWLAEDYDAFTTMCMAIDQVWHSGISFFYQLLGVILFFVPRTIWPSKPVGSGHTVAKSVGMSFTNISMPLPGEGYLNFGIVGVALFAFFVGFASSRFDKSFWITGPSDESRNIDLIYPVIMLMFFFICRGDLLSSWAYTFANLFVWFLFCQLVNGLSHLKMHTKVEK